MLTDFAPYLCRLSFHAEYSFSSKYCAFLGGFSSNGALNTTYQLRRPFWVSSASSLLRWPEQIRTLNNGLYGGLRINWKGRAVLRARCPCIRMWGQTRSTNQKATCLKLDIQFFCLRFSFFLGPVLSDRQVSSARNCATILESSG